MEDSPRTLVELEARFRDESLCHDDLVALRWPEGFVCPAGGHQAGGRGTAGSGVRPEGRKRSSGLKAWGFIPEIVRPEEAVGKHLLPRGHRVAGLLQRRLLGMPQGSVSPEPLDYSLDEDTFRFHRRTSRPRGKWFYRGLPQGHAG